MLQVNFIRQNKDKVIDGLKRRNYSEEALGVIDQILEADEQRKSTQTELDTNLAESNRLSKEIGQLFKQGKREEATSMKNRVAELKTDNKTLQEKLSGLKTQLEEYLLSVPNIPHPSVPKGNTDEDNEVYKDWSSELPDLGDDAQPHWELATKYNIFDLELGVKITGAGFPLYRNKGAKLQRALINFFLNEAEKAGYEEILPPLLVNADTARATGQLPDKEGQMYHVTKDELYLIPTAEVPVTNIYRNVIVREDEFPIKLT